MHQQFGLLADGLGQLRVGVAQLLRLRISPVVKRQLNSFSIAIIRVIWDSESQASTSAAVMSARSTRAGSCKIL
jgi:hypothetical protein